MASGKIKEVRTWTAEDVSAMCEGLFRIDMYEESFEWMLNIVRENPNPDLWTVVDVAEHIFYHSNREQSITDIASRLLNSVMKVTFEVEIL